MRATQFLVQQALLLLMLLGRKRFLITSKHGMPIILFYFSQVFALNIFRRSKELFASLNALRENKTVGAHVVDVRGQGLMVALEFASPSGSAYDPFIKPSAPANLSSRIAKRCVEKGMMILITSVYEVVRFIPPLNISQADLKKGCDIFTEAFEEVVREG
jgi:4-aminobutyrate aminotransferase